jgi:hypothetical protein
LGPEEGLEVGSVFVSCEEDGVNAFQDGQIDACASHHDCVFDSFAGALCRFIHFLFSFVGSVMEDLVVGKKSRTRLQGSSSRGRVSKRRGAACRRCCCGEEGAVISFFLSFFLSLDFCFENLLDSSALAMRLDVAGNCTGGL